MVKVTTVPALHDKLERAITQKLRTMDREDALNGWDRGLRLQALCRLEAQAQDDDHLGSLLAQIDVLDADEPPNLTDLLAALHAAFVACPDGEVGPRQALMGLALARPRMTAVALAHARQVDASALNGDERYVFELTRQELLVATGALEEAMAVLLQLDASGIQDMVLRQAFRLRVSALCWSRNSLLALRQAQQAQHELQTLVPPPAAATAWRSARVQCWRILSQYHRELCDDSAAQWHARAAVAEARAWVQAQPASHQARIALAKSLRQKGDVLAGMGVADVRLKAYKESMRIIERLQSRAQEDAHLRAELPASHDALGDIHFSKMQLDQAMQAYQASAAVAAHLGARDGDNVQWPLDQAKCALKIAQVFRHQRDYKAAIAMAQLSWSTLSSLLAKDPRSLGFMACAVETAELLGVLHALRHEASDANAWYARAQQWLVRAVAQDSAPQRWAVAMLSLSERVALAQWTQGEVTAAAQTFGKALRQLDGIRQQGRLSARTRAHLATLLLGQAALLQYCGRMEAAGQTLAVALQEAEAYRQLYPGSLRWRTVQANVRLQAAHHARLMGETEQADEHETQALQVLEKMTTGHAQNLELEHQWLMALLQATGHRSSMHAGFQRRLEDLLQRIRAHEAAGRRDECPQSLLVSALGYTIDWQLCQSQGQRSIPLVNERLGLLRQLRQEHPDAWWVAHMYMGALAQAARAHCATASLPAASECAQEGLALFQTWRQGECRHAGDAVPVGQLLLCQAQVFALQGHEPGWRRVQPLAQQVADWIQSTGTWHPEHLALAQRLQQMAWRN